MRLRLLVPAFILLSTLLVPGTWAQEPASPAPLAIDGFPLALSPDGASITGVDRTGEQFCVWDLTTLDVQPRQPQILHSTRGDASISRDSSAGMRP